MEKEKIAGVLSFMAENLYGFDFKNYFLPEEIKFGENGKEAAYHSELAFVHRFESVPVSFVLETCETGGYTVIVTASFNGKSVCLTDGFSSVKSLDDINSDFMEKTNACLVKFLDGLRDTEDEKERQELASIFSRFFGMLNLKKFTDIDTFNIVYNDENEGNCFIPVPLETPQDNTPLELYFILSPSGLHGSKKFYEITFMASCSELDLSKYKIIAILDDKYAGTITDTINKNIEKIFSDFNLKSKGAKL